MLLSLGTAIFKWQLKPPECSETANKSGSVKKKEECCNKESGNEGEKKRKRRNTRLRVTSWRSHFAEICCFNINPINSSVRGLTLCNMWY